MKTPYFINVDFELKSMTDLSALCSEMGDRISIMVNEKIGEEFCLNFEYVGDEEIKNLSSLMEAVLNALDNLSSASKKNLQECTIRVADIGFNSGEEGWLYESLPSQVLSKLVSYGFDLQFSIYGLEIKSNT